MNALERFCSKVEMKDPKTAECWNWKAYVGTHGYGRFWFRGKATEAYRVAYILFVGEIQEGLEIDHICRNRICVKPTHLRLITKKENILCGDGITAKNNEKLTCSQGHMFTFRRNNGQRYCYLCDIENRRKHNWYRKG